MNIKLGTILIAGFLYSVIPAMAQKGVLTKAQAKNEMKNGMKNGLWVEYMDMMGKPTTDTAAPYYTLSMYKKGKKNGLTNSYSKSGKLQSSTPYTDDKLNGTATYYYENGKVKGQSTWKKGSWVSRKDYDENGKEVYIDEHGEQHYK